ncbi:dynamin family protein [Ruminococcus flavefaciens]|uniref:dynamin family protein n=1 Tax=Ruminococcus flavefaciens TaxID=1265 RepID=UPI0026F1AE5C|nr:dynamin family protein [Ruminococcus flavefaciens]
MPRIKIISNPYENVITYRKYNTNSASWESIDANSDLWKEKYKSSVFPFVVKNIVDVIFNEFRSGNEQITILFEGTDDEFKELESVCQDEEYNGLLRPVTSVRYLRNARDILPDVKAIFDQMQPLISESVKDSEKVEREKRQFADVSKEAIPICVMGNYSSGKSTFINALIGYEILPSGDESLTAKIHKIEWSGYDDRASVGFEYKGKSIRLTFEEEGLPTLNTEDEEVLFEKIQQSLAGTEKESIIIRVSKVLEVLNDGDHAELLDDLSDIIEIKIPFNRKGVFGQSKNKFVIFDTPGSNSATNYEKHFEVLRKAMEDLSNGLPIYISEYKSLDTKDNQSLCDKINSMREMDSRFTLIVVNKADDANLEKSQFAPEIILNQTVPRNLYAGGVYFVSSIMGLGSKNGGEFIGNHLKRIYKKSYEEFSDPEDDFYQQLYIHDIMPDQIKKKSLEESEKQQNIIYANSGLYWIEEQIEQFAGIYSPYNKCHQSMLFLNKVITITSEEITRTKAICEERKKDMENQLERDKAALLGELTGKENELHTRFCTEYYPGMKTSRDEAEKRISKDKLAEREAELTKIRKSQTTFDEQNINVEASKKAVKEEAKKLTKADFSTLIGNIKESRDKTKELKETQKSINILVADDLLSEVKSDFNKNIGTAQLLLNKSSVNYWNNKSNEMKQGLAALVTGSTALSDEKREELAEIIMSFDPVSFEKQIDEIFIKTEFERHAISLFGIKLFDNNKLNLGKLSRTYNSELKEGIENISRRLQNSHELSFKSWTDNLMKVIRENITEYNPGLNKIVRYIAEDEKRINDLTERQLRLTQYTHEIEDMMSWKEREKKDPEIEE